MAFMAWSTAHLQSELEDLRTFGDDRTLVECKRAKSGMPESIGESLCAFANMPEGGTILLGVDERAGFAITGIENPAAMEKKVANFCRQTVEPAPQLEFTHVAIDGKNVLVITVIPLLPSLKPATYKSKPYLRQADGDYVMNANDLRILQVAALNEREREAPDYQSLVGSDVSMLDSELVEAFIKEARASSSRLRRVDDEARILQLTSVTDSEGRVRLAGLYALGFLPQTTEPALGATAAVRLSRTAGGARHRSLESIDGPLPLMLEQAMEWVRVNTGKTSAYNARGHLEDHPEFPMSAIREVIANALVHRDLDASLAAGKGVEIRLTDSALIITNPGGLKGLSVAQLESAELAKAAVNQRLYAIAKNLRTTDGMRVIEGEGGGIREVLFATRESKLPRPKFIDRGVEFKVIFPRGSRYSRDEQEWLEALDTGNRTLSAMQEEVLISLQRGDEWPVERVYREFSPLAYKEIDRDLDELQKAGLVREVEGRLELVEGHGALTVEKRPIVLPSGNAADMGKNVPALLAAMDLNRPKAVNELVEATGLTIAQVRYALEPLMEGGFVTMTGGRGRRGTVYELVSLP